MHTFAITNTVLISNSLKGKVRCLMFKTTSMSRSKNSGLTAEQILQFSLAEFSSAIEMIQAAKMVEDHKLQRGFIHHALDEYKHTNFFLGLLSKAENKRVVFDPRLIVSANFIKPEKFLFEQVSLVHFAAFIATNEANALKIFTSIRDEVKKFDENALNKLDLIITEETEHLMAMEQEKFMSGGEEANFVYDTLLQDEMRHVEFSSRFLKKQPSKSYIKIIRIKSSVATRFRHLWASQQTFRNIIDKTISVFVVLLLLPFRSTIELPSKKNKNLYCNLSARNMI